MTAVPNIPFATPCRYTLTGHIIDTINTLTLSTKPSVSISVYIIGPTRNGYPSHLRKPHCMDGLLHIECIDLAANVKHVFLAQCLFSSGRNR